VEHRDTMVQAHTYIYIPLKHPNVRHNSVSKPKQDGGERERLSVWVSNNKIITSILINWVLWCKRLRMGRPRVWFDSDDAISFSHFLTFLSKEQVFPPSSQRSNRKDWERKWKWEKSVSERGTRSHVPFLSLICVTKHFRPHGWATTISFLSSKSWNEERQRQRERVCVCMCVCVCVWARAAKARSIGSRALWQTWHTHGFN